MGLLALSALLVAGTGFFLFAKTIPNLSVSQKKVHKDLQMMQDEVQEIFSDPVALDKSDLDILSYHIAELDRKKRFTKKAKGIITSIFEEPMVGFFYRRYNKKDGLLYARTRHRSFYFWEKKGEARVVIDDQVLGSYRSATGVLIGEQSGRMIAKLDKENPDRRPLIIQGREVASIQLPTSSDVLQRVFDFTVSELSAEEEAIIIALTVFEIVKQAVTKN